MSFPVLPIFPEGSLAESVTTTVWVGVFVLALFNLRFGWTLSGLVTPGYLVPLMIVKPIAALVIWSEGILAYLLVLGFSAYGRRSGRWSSFFGRDRFFALVLCSIAVRVVMDGYFLPWVGRACSETWLREVDLSGDLHSFGLIIVSLIANQFWKPGLIRGLPPLVVTVVITYLIVRYPLMHLTNFNIGSLEYMYEDISSSMLASPKAYIILVITAFLASRLNLYYSWDFNGILIPSLLALQWYEPLKILTSFVEAWAIYCLASFILKLPMLKESTVEGARKILLFFNISFAYKLALGHILFHIDPQVQASEFFGFGYLLPSLIALKMHDKGIPARLTRTTLQASLVGTLGASLVGFALTLVPRDWQLSPASAHGPQAMAVPRTGKTLQEELREEKIALYAGRVSGHRASPLQTEMEAFSTGLKMLRSSILKGSLEERNRARAILLESRYDVVELEEGLLCLEELEPRMGWGIFVLDPGRPPGLVVEVPAPLDEWATLESGACFFKLFRATGLAISTSSPRGDDSQAEQALTSHRSFFNAFHRVFGTREALQVRGPSAASLRSLHESRGQARSELEEIPSCFWIQSRLPSGVSLSALQGLLGGITVEWGPPRMKNIQRDASRHSFSELFLNREDRKQLLARSLLGLEAAGEAGAADRAVVANRASLEAWLFESRMEIAERGTNLFQPARMESLLFLDEEVVKPLMELTARSRLASASPEKIATDLEAIQGPATALNYEVVRLREDAPGAEYVILRERPDAFPRRFWGTYIFRLGGSQPYAIEIPHPRYEMNTLEYGLSLFHRLSARALLIAGSHPKCNTDGSSDVVLPENKRTLFNLVNQVILRELKDEPFLVIQVRALGPKRGVVLPEADALLSLGDAGMDRSGLSPLSIELTSRLDEERLFWKFVDGSAITSGYEAQGSAQSQYLIQTRNKEFAALWLSPFIRLGYRQNAERSLQTAQFSALGIETTEDDLHLVLGSGAFVPDGVFPLEEILGVLERYHETQDINILHSLQSGWPECRLRRILDRGTRKTFLVLETPSGLLPAVMCLTWNPKLLLQGGRGVRFEAPLPPTPEDVQRYIRTGALFWIRTRGHEGS